MRIRMFIFVAALLMVSSCRARRQQSSAKAQALVGQNAALDCHDVFSMCIGTIPDVTCQDACGALPSKVIQNDENCASPVSSGDACYCRHDKTAACDSGEPSPIGPTPPADQFVDRGCKTDYLECLAIKDTCIFREDIDFCPRSAGDQDAVRCYCPK